MIKHALFHESWVYSTTYAESRIHPVRTRSQHWVRSVNRKNDGKLQFGRKTFFIEASEQLLPGSSRSEDSRTPASKNVSNGRVVRPFVRTPKAPREKPADAFASLLQEVISHQKIASSRVSPFESAVAAFKAGHAEGLTSAEVRGIICLFSENAPFVNQFLSFDEESRDFIIAEKLTQLDY